MILDEVPKVPLMHYQNTHLIFKTLSNGSQGRLQGLINGLRTVDEYDGNSQTENAYAYDMMLGVCRLVIFYGSCVLLLRCWCCGEVVVVLGVIMDGLGDLDMQVIFDQ
jgi:hypothetical protein